MLTNHTPFSELDKYGEFDVSKTVDGVKYQYMEDTKLGHYLKSVHYADKCLGEFFDALEKNGLLDNTVIVLYGDHDARLPIEDYQRFYNYDITTNDVLPEPVGPIIRILLFCNSTSKLFSDKILL